MGMTRRGFLKAMAAAAASVQVPVVAQAAYAASPEPEALAVERGEVTRDGGYAAWVRYRCTVEALEHRPAEVWRAMQLRGFTFRGATTVAMRTNRVVGGEPEVEFSQWVKLV